MTGRDSFPTTTWLNDRQRDGGVDRIALPSRVPGALFLCGKQAVATRFGSAVWDTVVCLTERHEIEGHYPDYLAWLTEAPTLHSVPDPNCKVGDGKVWWPIPDLHAPPLDEMRQLAGAITERLAAGERVLVHCAAGKGRAGTTAVCVLIELGVSLADATAIVAQCRPGAGPEVGAQRDLVRRFGGMP